MRFVSLLIALLATCAGFAADPVYPVSAIPEDMKKNMYGVIREEIFEFRVLAKDKSSYRVREVITILNPNGKRLAEKVVGYDKMRRITSLKAASYDANGKLIKKLKPSDIYDRSAFDGFSLFSDNRIKYVDLSHNIYPYTVEFEYEVENKFLYSFPTWRLYSDDEVSIQRSVYTIIYPPNLKPRYKTVNAPEPTKSTEGNTERLEWLYTDFKPLRWEKLAPDSRRFVPTVLAGPVDFDYGGYPGRMDTWENFGKWQWSVNAGRDKLPDATIQKVKSMTEGKSDYEKIKILYEFLQNKTRYVSIQVGIGGLQPFEARVVDQMGYGDCKALSNYMVALLKEVGITGYYTTIMAGQDAGEVFTDFPNDQSNHIIVAVPHKNDTIWLECTSQTTPFGYLGRFTQNRYGHLIAETGSKLVKTPSYDANTDVMIRKANVKLNANGRGTASVLTRYKGARYDDDSHVGYYTTSGADDQKTWVQKNVRIPSFDIQSYNMKTTYEGNAPVAEVSLNLTLPNLATVSGKRLFLTPNLMNRNSFVPEKLEKRVNDIVVRTPLTDIDSVIYEIPEDIFPEFLPEPVTITSPFGEYESRFFVDQGKVVYFRRFKVKSGEFPPQSYQELVDFYKSVTKADNTKLVFLTKT